MVYSKRRTRTAAVTKIEPEPIHITRYATRKLKQTKEIETIKPQSRKRKQSISDDGNENNPVTLRKKKAAVPPPARKARVKKTKGLSL